MRKLLPLLLILLGVGGGAAAGFLLKPQAEEVVEIDPCGEDGAPMPVSKAPETDPGDREYVKMNNQFVVPTMAEGRISGLVVMSLSLEVGPGGQDLVFAREPKLRDVFLPVLFYHANACGFDGAFTHANRLDPLRAALRGVAVSVLGGVVSDVLIVDIARQDN